MNDVQMMMWGWGWYMAWWVIKNIFFFSPSWTCLGDLPPDMPRRRETWVLMLKLCGISHNSAILGSDSPQSNKRKGKSIHPRQRPNVKHSITGYLRLPRPTPVPALMRVLHWLRCWAEELVYFTGNPPEDYGQIRGGCSFPWMIAVD